MKTKSSISIIGAAAMAVTLAISSPAHAQLSGQLGILDLSANGGINPGTGIEWQAGDKYHLIFVTTGTTNATSSNIATYNAFIQAEAAAEGMGSVSWFALGSTATTNAIDNAIITGPVMNAFNSATLAINSADFWDFLFPANTLHDFAGNLRNVWTGTTGGGVGSGGNRLGTTGTNVRRHWTGWTNWIAASANQNKNDQLYMIGISEELTISGPATSFLLTIAPNAEAPGSYDLEWDSQEGKLYNLRTSSSLDEPIAAWDLVEGDIDANPPTNVYHVQGAGPRRFYAVEEFDAPPPPPLIAEDFENVVGPNPPAGWSRSDNGAGTAWEVGTPAAGSTGVPSAAAVGSQCAGTNINAQYTANAEASLVTPAFTVPSGGATLNFRQYIDTETSPSNDVGSIRLLSAANNSFLADVVTNIQGITEEWSQQSISLPAAANGQAVKIEFRFTSDATNHWGGFYIDDVVVSPN